MSAPSEWAEIGTARQHSGTRQGGGLWKRGELGRKIRPFLGIAGDNEEEHILETFPFQSMPSSALGRPTRKFSSKVGPGLSPPCCGLWGWRPFALRGGRRAEKIRGHSCHCPSEGDTDRQALGSRTESRAPSTLSVQAEEAQLLFQ